MRQANTQTSPETRNLNDPGEAKWTPKPVKATKSPKTPRNLRPRSARANEIIELKQNNPALTMREIATLTNCDHSNVVRVLQRYGIVSQEVNDFKSHRADILAGLQDRLIKSITTEDIQKAPLGSRILAAAQLYDKERLELGKTTSNLAQVVFQMPAPKPVPDELKMGGKLDDKVVDIDGSVG